MADPVRSFRYFAKDPPRSPSSSTAASWQRRLTFRDALRADEEERKRYTFKRQLVAEGHPRQVYTELKAPFLREVEAHARARRNSQRD